MKKLVLLSATFLLATFWLGLSAQEVKKDELKTEIRKDKMELKSLKKEFRLLEGNVVSEVTKHAFLKDFGNYPNARWQRGKYLDEVTITKDGKEFKAYYDFDSELVGTISLKSISDLPMKAQNEIKTKYSNYKIDKVMFFDDNPSNEMDMFIFETRLDDVDCYFAELSNTKGTIILKIDTDGSFSEFKTAAK